MNIDVFLRSRNDDWLELASLMADSRGRISRLDSHGILRFSALYRSACADLAYARREYAGDAVHYNLETMVARCSSMMYEHRSIDKKKVLYFLTTGAFASIAQRPRLLLMSFLLMMVPWIACSFYAVHNPDGAQGLAPAGVENVVQRPSANFNISGAQKAEVSSQILTHNIQITFLAFVGGITAGVVTIITLVFQGVSLGTVFGLTISAGNGDVLWKFVFPHGFLEISCIIVAGAAGLRIGWALISPGFRTRARALRDEGRQALCSALVVAVSLFFCGIVEGSISTSGVPTAVGLSIGLSLFTIFWGLIIRGGVVDAQQKRELSAPL